ncbi:MAG: GNAT family N-acetyltransferase [Alphaproteobacteria bacterium]|jgi:predicted acetyltransferase|nr:GNAT family N-acetyltransferase [Alphaproteobacteria bacterium]
MTQSFLIRPTPIFRESYLDALREGLSVGGRHTYDASEIAAVEQDFTSHLARLDRDGQSPAAFGERTLPSVPANAFWLVEGETFIGAVTIRSRIDTHLLAHFSGHLGYGVRPSMQGRGYGKRQLALALDICRGMGIGIARLSCDVDNIASRRVIEANGGVLLRQCAPSWFVESDYFLYEIPLI